MGSTISTEHWTLNLGRATDCVNDEDGSASERTVRRDGDLDLVFDGWHVAHATMDLGAFRNLGVDVWVTTTGRIVTAETRSTSREGETSRYAAAAHTGHGRAYGWLVDRTGGKVGSLGGVSKQAWVQTCRVVAELAGQDRERV